MQLQDKDHTHASSSNEHKMLIMDFLTLFKLSLLVWIIFVNSTSLVQINFWENFWSLEFKEWLLDGRSLGKVTKNILK